MNRIAVVLTCALMLTMSEQRAAKAQVMTGDTALLSLQEAIQHALTVSPLRRAAQARSDAAGATVFQASRYANPSVDIREENLSLQSGRRSPVDQTVDVFAIVSQPLDVSGKRSARTAVATSDRDAARASFAQVERAVMLETMRLYLATLRAYHMSTLLTAQRAALQTVIDTMTRRVAEGYAAEAELMRFRSEAVLLDTQLVRTKLDLQRQALSLSTFIGMPTPIDGTRLLALQPLDPPLGDAEEIVLRALEHRPELIAARARLASAQHTVALERARRIPDIAFALGYKRTAGQDTVVTGFVVPLPVFDQNTGNIERALAEERAVVAELEATTRQLKSEMMNAIRTAQELTVRARSIEEQLLQPATIVRRAAQTAFLEGAGTVLQLVDAERVYTDARREALAIELEAYAATFEARLVVNGEVIP